MKISYLLFSVTLIFIFGCSSQAKIKNAILFIGDGMGPSVVTATRIQFKGKGGMLNVDKFPYTAKVKTYSKGYIVTDSAAAGTAMATGNKVEGGVLGRNSEASPPKHAGFSAGKNRMGKSVPNIVELAARSGRLTGIVSSTHVLHATPAAFFAHVNDRHNFNDISAGLLESPVHILYGGGQKNIKPYRKALQKKFDFIEKMDPTPKCSKNQTIGVFAPGNLDYVYERTKNNSVSLKTLTRSALRCLSNSKNGFFLMVEGGRIDHALHERKVVNALHETYEFDQVIGETLEYLKSKNLDKETLVLVTADHNTGGLSMNAPLPDTDSLFQKNNEPKVIQHYSGKGPKYPVLKLATGSVKGKKKVRSAHTGVDVSLYAVGPTAENVHGTIDNTEIFSILTRALGLGKN